MITDWDDAYANRDHVPGTDAIIATWEPDAAAFRHALGSRAETDIAYGDGARRRYDLFQPKGQAKGLVVFIHGGYWRMFDKTPWSHFMAGPMAHGWAAAVPSYPLAPSVPFPEITQAAAVAVMHAAARVDGPIVLVGHSAGGHLVARLATEGGPVAPDVLKRIVRVVPISGLFDLRPMLRLAMNDDWKLDLESAIAESPVFQMPTPGIRITAWVGGAERPEFLRHTALLENAWSGCGADIRAVYEPDRHHFDVIDGLKSPDHPLTSAIIE